MSNGTGINTYSRRPKGFKRSDPSIIYDTRTNRSPEFTTLTRVAWEFI